MADAVLQTISCPPSPCSPKLLYPGISVKKAGSELRGFNSVSRSSSRGEPSDSLSVVFSGQEYYSDLDPQAVSPPLFSCSSQYIINSSGRSSTLFSGYPEGRRQSLVSQELTTSVEFLEKIQLLLQPKSRKIFIDVLNYTRTVVASAGTGFVTCRELVELILTLSGSGIGITYLGFDYRINNYKNEDYPLNIIRDLVEFVGCYIKYNPAQNTIEILEKNPPISSTYDFLYVDDGDIIDLGDDDNLTEYYNAIIVEGIEPDLPPSTTTASPSSPTYPIDDNLYLIDTVMGKEPAPQDPYIDTPPTELIKKKFFNVYLGFDIDPSTIDVKGGAWNETTKKYEGAEFLGYGGFTPASSILLSSATAPPISSSLSLPLSSGEGLIGIPWNYEKNDPSAGNFALADGMYTSVDLLGKVIKSTDGIEISGAQVELDFANLDNIWQYWRHTIYNVVVRFYLPDGSVALSSDWEDVTSSYPPLDPPLGFPKMTITASGATVAGVGGAGTFSFSEIPISQYTATASAVGYDDNDITIEYDNDSLWDFLKSSGANPNKDYILVDTPYQVAIYAKKAPPIIFGATPTYTTPAAIIPPSDVIRVDVRHNRGITLAGGKLIYAPTIRDVRIITEEIAVKVGASFLADSLSKRTRKTLQVPHNPWLRVGDKICVQSYAKSWTGSNKKLLIIDSIATSYNVGGQGEEGLYDVVEGVEQF